MGSLGFSEIILLMGIALIVIGPEKFPDFIKVVLKTFRDLRGYVDDVKRDISNEMKPVEKEIRSLSHYDPETYIDALSRGEIEDTRGTTDGSKDAAPSKTGASAGKSVPANPEVPKPEPYASAEAETPRPSPSEESGDDDQASADAGKKPPPEEPLPSSDEPYED